jgi:uncharacterized damage-inducible protein DinB
MKDMEKALRNEVIDSACYRMEESMRMIGKCIEKLSENDIWRRPNTSSNSIGNIMLHLCGNIRQYAIASLGGREDIRERDKEFSARSGYDGDALLKMLGETVAEAAAVMRGSDAAALIRVRKVQGFELSGIGVITHVVEHLSYHTGQIAFWTKILMDTDLGFYKGVDLNQKNS